MTKANMTVSGRVPLIMKIDDGKLTCNSARGCSVLLDGKEVYRTEVPVWEKPVGLGPANYDLVAL
jgi:hypothetical protein